MERFAVFKTEAGRLAVFECVVEEVEDDIGEVHLVGTDDGVFRLEVGGDGAADVLHLKGEGMCHIFDDAVCIELVHLECGGFSTFEEAGL